MDVMRKKWANTLGRLASAAVVAGSAVSLWSCTKTVDVGDPGVVATGIDGYVTSVYVMVGDIVVLYADPTDNSQNPINGAKVRWRSEDPGIAVLAGPEVTISNYHGRLDDRSRALFKGVSVGTTHVVGTLEGSPTDINIITGKPRVLSVTIEINVISPPSRIDLVAQATTWRVGQGLLLDAKVYSAQGVLIPNLYNTPYAIVFHCLDAPVGVFSLLETPRTGVDACRRFATSKGRTYGYPPFAETEMAEEVVGITTGTARFEAVLERRDGTNQATVPNVRAQITINFVPIARSWAFDPPSLTVRLGSAANVAFHMRDGNGNELPIGDIEGTVKNEFLAGAIRTLTGFRIVGRGLPDVGPTNTTLDVLIQEGLYLSPGAKLSGELTLFQLPLIVLPRILDVDFPSDITVFEGELRDFPLNVVLAAGTSITEPFENINQQIVSENPALATGGFNYDRPKTFGILGRSAGPTGVVRVGMTYKTVNEGGFTKQFFVTVRRLLLAMSPPQARVNLGATQLFVLNQVDESNRVLSAVPNDQIAWTSADAAIATVDATGVARCTQLGGTVAIRGTHTATRVFASASLTCGTAPTISTPAAVTVEVGKPSATITATVLNATGAVDVSWSAPANPNFTITKTGASTATVFGVSVTTADVPLTATYTQTGTPYTATTSIKVIPAVVNGYSVAATTVAFTPGSTTPTPATLPITRTGTFTAALGFVSATGAPAGLSIVPSATSFSTAVTLSISGTAATGTYPIAVTTNAIGSTLPPQTTTLTVVVGASSTPTIAAVYLDPRDAEMTASAAVAGAGGLTYRARLVDSQGNEVAYASSGGTLAYTSSTPSAVRISPFSTGPAIVTGLSGANTVVTIIRATFTKGTQTLTDETPLTIYPSSSPVAHYGTAEISMPRDARVLKVGDKIQVPVIVRDRNGIQQLSGVTGLTLTSSNPAAIEIAAVTPIPGAPANGYFFELTVKVATSFPGIRLTADLIGAASSIYVIVTPP